MQPDLPLRGIRVIDLGWITAGAATSTLLLDLGADVIKLEGPDAPDPFRLWDGAQKGTDWWNRSPFFNFTNRGKRQVCLDLKHPRGQDVLFTLLENADVMVENFRRGVLAGWGIDFALLRARFPGLIIASISSQGETGPDRDMVSFGSTLEATGGLAALTGTGAAPAVTGRNINYPDQVVSLFAAGAIVAAILQRDRTGQGAHLDLSQRELTSFLLGEELLAAGAGAASERRGNHDPGEPDETLAFEAGAWTVRFPGGSAPVRDARTLVEAAEFNAGTSLLRSADGAVAKGTPFRLTCRPAPIPEACRPFAADNHAVLRAAGIADDVIDELERGVVIANAPTRR